LTIRTSGFSLHDLSQTRHTLIRRIAQGGSDDDWQVVVTDYWRAVCEFVARRASLSYQDAEDVASKTFEVLVRKELLVKWQSEPTAKLRTLICRISLNVLSNELRVQRGRKRFPSRRQAPCDRRRIRWKNCPSRL
jgi:DNA-directed RNA polymerase specialized sigma24 family protein